MIMTAKFWVLITARRENVQIYKFSSWPSNRLSTGEVRPKVTNTLGANEVYWW